MISKTPPKNSSLASFAKNSVAVSAAASIDAVMGDTALGDAASISGASISKAFNSHAYHELLENPHVELDGLQRLQENLAQLQDLHGRLRFMMRDLTGLLRRR